MIQRVRGHSLQTEFDLHGPRTLQGTIPRIKLETTSKHQCDPKPKKKMQLFLPNEGWPQQANQEVNQEATEFQYIRCVVPNKEIDQNLDIEAMKPANRHLLLAQTGHTSSTQRLLLAN